MKNSWYNPKKGLLHFSISGKLINITYTFYVWSLHWCGFFLLSKKVTSIEKQLIESSWKGYLHFDTNRVVKPLFSHFNPLHTNTKCRWQVHIFYFFFSSKMFEIQYIFHCHSWIQHGKCIPMSTHRGVTGTSLWGGKVIFPDFIPKCFFPVENSHFGSPKTNFCRFQKWKAKKKKAPLSYNFSYFHFQFSFCSSQFSTLFPFFLASFFRHVSKNFPVRSKKKKKKKKHLFLITFPTSISNFPSFLLNFQPFFLFSLPLFSDTSAKISRSEVSGGHSAPLPPSRLLCHWVHTSLILVQWILR